VPAETPPVTFIDLEAGDPRLDSDLLPVLVELRTHLTPETFRAVYAEGHPQGLRFTAAYLEGECVGVAGWRVMASTYTLRKLYVDDLVTRASARSTGVGRALLRELEDRARAAGARVLDLDSGVQRAEAHRFYLRERVSITLFHFAKDLTVAS
jgi:GNAT superfamily N-acetyltransferase